MNTIGKILVILNLVFALLVGGFLVIDFSTRTNWKASYELLKQQMEIARANSDVAGKTTQGLVTQFKRSEAEKEELKQKLVDQETVAAARFDSQKRLTDEQIEKAKDADLNAQKAIAEKERLKEEVKGLNATLAKRDTTILAIQDDNRKLRIDAVAKEQLAQATQSRNESLLNQLQEANRKLMLRDAGVGSDKSLTKDPNAPNPPSTYVKGKVERVDPTDRSVVQISLGTDQGINKSHTLLVYRLVPEPQYLGMIRIVDAKEHIAVGQLIRNNVTGNRIPLREGDIVASSLNNDTR